MGTRIRIVLYAHGPDHADRAAREAYAVFSKVDARMSDYKPDSELSRLSRASGAVPRAISEPLFTVLAAAQRIARQTGGGFDVTVGPVVRLWREARKKRALPDPQAIRRAKERVGWRHLVLDAEGRTARLEKENMLLDLGGIAKGYACDEALRALRREGVTRAFIDAGGGMALGDPPPDRAGWRIQVADRQDLVLEISNCGVATSGDTEQFVQIDGVRYSHIVDPATGVGLTDRSMVTVIAPDGITADALATAVSVMGPERGPAHIETLEDTEVWIRWVDERKRRTRQSSGFPDMIK